MPVSLNQYRGETGSFYNRSTSQITEMTISLFNILVNFTKNVLVYIILLTSLFFLTLLDQFSSCNIIYLRNFMTHLFYYRLLTSFLGKFSGKFDLFMLCRDIDIDCSSCIDLIFTSQPNLVMISGVHSSLHPVIIK